MISFGESREREENFGLFWKFGCNGGYDRVIFWVCVVVWVFCFTVFGGLDKGVEKVNSWINCGLGFC